MLGPQVDLAAGEEEAGTQEEVAISHNVSDAKKRLSEQLLQLFRGLLFLKRPFHAKQPLITSFFVELVGRMGTRQTDGTGFVGVILRAAQPLAEIVG